MLSPSLHVHYKHFITTTTKSAPCSSTTSFVVCFLLLFNRTLQGSLVPYYSLNTCLAYWTPDAVYPVIRYPVHSVADQTWTPAFDIVFCPYETSSLVHLRSTHCILTCRNRYFRFSLSLTTHSLRYKQHKVVWQLLLKVVAERSALICNKASKSFQRTLFKSHTF